MLRRQTWVPDTHDASFDCEWDDESPDAPHNCVAAVIQGISYEGEAAQAQYERVLAVNQLKNMARQTLIDTMPADMVEMAKTASGEPMIDVLTPYVYRTPLSEPAFSVDQDSGLVTFTVSAPDTTIGELHDAVTSAHGDDVKVVAE